MARKKHCKVFVSYSRHDEALVKPLAGLLGAAADDAIFLDVDSIQPGDLWKDNIEDAVRDCSVFILCWCCQSEQSQFVQHEIKMALEGKDKRLVPVLLCSTPLPASLTNRQWVDLRGQIVHSCQAHPKNGVLEPAPAAPKEARTASFVPWKVTAIAASVVSVLVLLLARFSSVTQSSALPPDVVPTPGPEPAAAHGYTSHDFVGVITIFAITLIIGGFLWWLRRAVRSWKRRREANRISVLATTYFKTYGQSQS